MKRDEPQIVIIGGGGSGAATARELTLLGYRPILVERDEVTGGTTGRHHGQLHSGARYAMGDREIARECLQETAILRRIAPGLIEDNGGLFVALNEQEAEYATPFCRACGEAGIHTDIISGDQARQLEPALSVSVSRGVLVPADASFDAYRLPLAFFAAAMAGGARIYRYIRAKEIEVTGGRVASLQLRDRITGKEHRLPADVIINAGGPWVGAIAALAGIGMEVTPSPGTMVAVKGRLVRRVVSRLRPPDDGDIIVPQRDFSIIGSTQRISDNPDSRDSHTPAEGERELLLNCADQMLPAFSSAPFRAAWSAPRPLAKKAGELATARALSRDFVCVHHEHDGAEGLFSMVGGKATVLRAMGAETALLVHRYLQGQNASAKEEQGRLRSVQEQLPPYRTFYPLFHHTERERNVSWEGIE